MSNVVYACARGEHTHTVCIHGGEDIRLAGANFGARERERGRFFNRCNADDDCVVRCIYTIAAIEDAWRDGSFE